MERLDIGMDRKVKKERSYHFLLYALQCFVIVPIAANGSLIPEYVKMYNKPSV